MINACSHRGAQLCRHKRGNKATYTCPFHGWTFNNSGKLLKVKIQAMLDILIVSTKMVHMT
jgi:benzoate/toluate 1,2-dioxygenase alpha subunit